MNTVLWVVQVLLALVFTGAGAVKLLRPPDKLAQTLGDWVHGMPAGSIKALGAAELAGAIGVIAPAATGIAPALTPLAAAALAVTMAGAVVVHARRGEYRNVAVNVVLAAMAVLVAWGRFGHWGS